MTEGYRQIQNEYINKYRTNNNIYKTGRERRVCDHVGLTPYKPDLAITPGDSKVRLWNYTRGKQKSGSGITHEDRKSQALELHTGIAKVRL